MDGQFLPGWYNHPNLGLIKIYERSNKWVYVCYSNNGQKALSKERTIDQWIWALSNQTKDYDF